MRQQRVRTEAALATSRWRASPARLVRLFSGLWLFGAGEACVVASELGNSPWTVLAEGVAVHTPLTIGVATQLVGVAVLLAWWPLRERPGLGTVANVVVIGVALDVVHAVLPAAEALAWRGVLLLAGIALVGLGSGLYLTTALGPGPRDGLMTGLARVSGRPFALVRAVIEVTALTVGVVLGGTAGVGTLVFALLIGPAVGLGVRVCGGPARVGAPPVRGPRAVGGVSATVPATARRSPRRARGRSPARGRRRSGGPS